jgi:hypothetical protein
MKYFWCLLVISILYSCETINPEEEIPSFLFIDDVELETSSAQGLPSANITDVWVYTADEFLGVFPLPAKVPVLADGSSDITAVAGIKKNGITASRLDYPFFSQYNETVELNRNEICSIMPIVNYTIDEFPLVENFEGNGSIFEVVTRQ